MFKAIYNLLYVKLVKQKDIITTTLLLSSISAFRINELGNRRWTGSCNKKIRILTAIIDYRKSQSIIDIAVQNQLISDIFRSSEHHYATGQWFSLGPPVSSTNKTDRHNIAKILLKVALNAIKLNHTECVDKISKVR